MNNEASWYEIVDKSDQIMQGELLKECTIAKPTLAESKVCYDTVEYKTYDVIILSQSCDLNPKKPKVDLVLVCPLWSLSDFAKSGSYFDNDEGKEDLRKGNCPGYHLLHKCNIEPFQDQCLVVDFRNIFGVPFEYITYIANNSESRICLCSPYREHLSQAYARFIMRVGLPSDIPSFIDKKVKNHPCKNQTY
jgi:hypothetical protein